MTFLLFLIISIGVAAVVFFMRALPFFFAKQLRESVIARVLSYSLPVAIMLLLVLHEMQGSPKTIFALIGVGVTALAHLTFKQPVISIIAGTVVYMFLMRYV